MHIKVLIIQSTVESHVRDCTNVKIREFKQEPSTSTGGGLFALLSADFEQIFGQIVSIRVSNW